jgi:hypothetical protein
MALNMPIYCQKLQFDEFVDFGVPRNAKALKCIFLAGEGIVIQGISSYSYTVLLYIIIAGKNHLSS